MATTRTDIETRVLELAPEAMEAFCKDISGMFDVQMECRRQEIIVQTVAQFKERFEKLVAVNIVDSRGVLDGTFQLIFDQDGLFTLGGVMVMLPEEGILANITAATVDLAKSMSDAVGEAGNLMVSAWERIFREGLKGHGHFQQRLPAFVGEPWDNSQENIGLSPDDEHVFMPYEIAISPYPAFTGGVILPKSIFDGDPAGDSDEAAPAHENTEQEQTKQQDSLAEAYDSEEPAEDNQPNATGRQDAATAEEIIEGLFEAAKTKSEPQMGPVSGAIKELARSQASPSKVNLIDNPALSGANELLWVRAGDIIQTRVVWAGPDDSVQRALTKMQQNDVGYLIVGGDEALEGIVSKADVAGAMSPYLRPMFARWRRPADDATMKIKLKWIMSRPVRTAGLDTPLATILENMCRFGGRALPVVDEQGKVHGIVTAFDVFRVLLDLGAAVPTAGNAPQGPPL